VTAPANQNGERSAHAIRFLAACRSAGRDFSATGTPGQRRHQFKNRRITARRVDPDRSSTTFALVYRLGWRHLACQGRDGQSTRPQTTLTVLLLAMAGLAGHQRPLRRWVLGWMISVTENIRAIAEPANSAGTLRTTAQARGSEVNHTTAHARRR
jgi:hypothetical protein